MSEMIDDMIQSFGLFQSENENYKTSFSYEFLEYWNNKLSLGVVAEVDCMEVYRNNENVPEFYEIKCKLYNDIKTIDKYGILNSGIYSNINLKRKHLDFWKNTELKKLKKMVKERFGGFVHSIRVDFQDRHTVFPQLKVIFSRQYPNQGIRRHEVATEIKKFVTELGFSKQIRINW